MWQSRAVVIPIGCLLAVSACDPYDRYGKNEDSLGPADPLNFPPANLGIQPDGSPGNRRQSGLGAFTAIPAFVAGREASYFAYPFLPDDPDVDPLRIEAGEVDSAYVFESGYRCFAAAGYRYDPRLDEVPLDQQGNIFTALPKASYTPELGPRSSYVPLVAQIPVAAPSMGCQQPKSEEALERLGRISARAPDGRYLAFLIIDPGSPVFPARGSVETHPGVGIQRWGWYERYLVAYLDGGEVRTEQVTVMEGTPPVPTMVRRMVPQRLYVPRSLVMSGGAMPVAAPGEVGAGYDVMAARRGDLGYSPVCALYTYDAGAPRAAADLPKDAATIETTFNTPGAPLEPGSPPFVFCLQAATP